MCVIEDSSWLKGLQWWMISKVPFGLGATMPIEGWILSCGGTYVLNSNRSGKLFLLGVVSASLGKRIGELLPLIGPFLQFC